MSTEENRFVAVRERRELAAVVLVLLVFIAVNFAVATHTPTVVPDEPESVDAAANFYLGDGFTSTLWAQDRNAFWIGYVPLHAMLLCGFFHLFGFGLFQARALNTVLAALAGWMIWLAVRRMGLIGTAPYRLLCLLLVLSGSVSTLTIRTARPDTAMFAVCATIFLAWSIRSAKLRVPVVFLASSLLLTAGLAMLPYVPLMLFLYVLVFGFEYIGTVFAAFFGVLSGIGWLSLFYGSFSSIGDFIRVILPFTGIGGARSSPGHTLALKFFGNGVDVPDTIFTSFFGYPLEFENPKTLFDYSSALLFLAIVVLAISQRNNLSRTQRRVFLFTLLVVFTVPPSLHLAGHYRSMYRWMSYLPLCVLAANFSESILQGASAGVVLRRTVAGIFLVSLTLGLPMRSLVIIPSWSERSIRPIDAAAQRIVTKSDVVVCNEKVYFAVRPLAKTVFLTELPARGSFDQIVDLPKSEISLLCLKPEEVDAMTQLLGGKWEHIPAGTPEQEAELSKTRYAVEFYRRVPAGENP